MSGSDPWESEDVWGDQLDSEGLWRNEFVNSTRFSQDVLEGALDVPEVNDEWDDDFEEERYIRTEYSNYQDRGGELQLSDWINKLNARQTEIFDKTGADYDKWVTEQKPVQTFTGWTSPEKTRNNLPYELWRRRNVAKIARSRDRDKARAAIQYAPLEFCTIHTGAVDTWKRNTDSTLRSSTIEVTARKIQATIKMLDEHETYDLEFHPILQHTSGYWDIGTTRIYVLYDPKQNCYFLPWRIGKVTTLSGPSTAPTIRFVRFDDNVGKIISLVKHDPNNKKTPFSSSNSFASEYRRRDECPINSSSPARVIYEYLLDLLHTKPQTGRALEIFVEKDTPQLKVEIIGIFSSVRLQGARHPVSVPTFTLSFEKRINGNISIIGFNDAGQTMGEWGYDRHNTGIPSADIIDEILDAIEGRVPAVARAWREMEEEYKALVRKWVIPFTRPQTHKMPGDVSAVTLHASGKFRLRRERHERDRRGWDL